ncbi:hypothetical protein C6N40_13305 [Arenimonas caeni]|uniref:Uncharacterized protein n=2 Tax=Arenimonas caeni TaxID=2058085 RepID=A0A2P6M5N1_9GAMM|nr:hypothetical protein C6N40_13305 [Arenimonas caeni]
MALPDPRRILRIRLFEDCVVRRPRRPLPSNLVRWASQQPIPQELRELGLTRALCEALARMWPDLLGRFRRGFIVESIGIGRRITCFGCVQYDIAGNGTIEARHALPVKPPKAFGFRLDRPLSDWAWVGWVAIRAKAAFAELADALRTRRLAGMIPPEFPTNADLLAWDWLVRNLIKLAKRCIDQRKAEHLLVNAFQLDPALVLAFSRSVPKLLRRRSWFLKTFWWNRCVQFRDPLLTLQACAPALLPYYGELMVPGREASKTDYFGQIRAKLEEEGLQDQHWHVLLFDKAKPIWRLWYSDRIRAKDCLHRALVDWGQRQLCGRGIVPADETAGTWS